MSLFFVAASMILVEQNSTIVKTILPGSLYLKYKLSHIAMAHIKIGYFCLLSAGIFKSFIIKFRYRKQSKLIFSSRLHRILHFLLLFILVLNFLLIAIVNPSLLNPGPKSLNVCYQNVQGLIPIKDLSLKQPSLNETKIKELNAYIDANKPDIVILNETWLKNSISNREIINNELYSDNVYRNDRSRVTHPEDHSDPNKYKKYGGGVLIAFRSDIKAQIKHLSARKGAEILACEVTIDDKKFVFCTVYRVGNLGEPNHQSIMNTIKSFYKIRNPRKYL